MKVLFVFLILVVACGSADGAIIAQADSVMQETKTKVPITTEANSEKWHENKAMPWIASIVIAVLTVLVNLIISYSTRRTSLKVVKSQIESSVKLARVQFQSTLNSKNRQDWINEVRNCISEFATHARQLNIHFQNQQQDTNQSFLLHEKVFLYKSKIRLLLTPTIKEHLTFLNAQEDLMNTLEIHLLNAKANIAQYDNQGFLVKLDFMIEKGRELLYFEWQKVQNAKFETLDQSSNGQSI